MEHASVAKDQSIHDTSMNKKDVEKAKVNYDKHFTVCQEASQKYAKALGKLWYNC
jgi:hypothetical protein